jgi:DNA ligase-1
MVNINSAPYSFKRTKNLLKVKTMKEVDLMIVGFEEGSGRLTGTLGRITVEYKGNEVGVSGFTDAERKFFWENQDDLMGRVVCVQYFEETKNANGGVSLRFPVFKELREEGKEVSYQ